MNLGDEVEWHGHLFSISLNQREDQKCKDEDECIEQPTEMKQTGYQSTFTLFGVV